MSIRNKAPTMSSKSRQNLTIIGVATVMVIFLASLGSGHVHNAQRVLLRDIKTISLYADDKTTGRRSSPGCHSDVLPRSMQCNNVGYDGVDVQWRCTSELDRSVKLGRTTVTCEGYDYPDDPYVLAGSCGVEYTLESTGDYASHQHHHHRQRSSSGGSNFFFILVLGFLTYQMYKWCSNNMRGREMFNNPDMGPHPDNFRPGSYPYGSGGAFPPGYGGPSSGAGCTYPPPSYQRTVNEGGGWNFWHGFGLGGLLGYLVPRRNMYGYNAGYPSTGFHNTRAYPSNYAQRTQTFPTSTRSSSTRTHSSTGFGGTRRR